MESLIYRGYWYKSEATAKKAMANLQAKHPELGLEIVKVARNQRGETVVILDK